jgi:hypothetical protein
MAIQMVTLKDDFISIRWLHMALLFIIATLIFALRKISKDFNTPTATVVGNRRGDSNSS